MEEAPYITEGSEASSPPPPTSASPPASFPAQWSKHADRCWEAERENAERINDRRRQILTASAALFGLSLFGVQWLRDPNSVSNIRWDVICWCMRGLLGSALVFFLLALWQMMRLKKSDPTRTSFASHTLEIPPDGFVQLDKLSASEAESRTFYLTYEAFLDLKKRNASVARTLEKAQASFLYGAALVFLAVIAYIFTSYPPIKDNGQNDAGGSYARLDMALPTNGGHAGFIQFRAASNDSGLT